MKEETFNKHESMINKGKVKYKGKENKNIDDPDIQKEKDQIKKAKREDVKMTKTNMDK